MDQQYVAYLKRYLLRTQTMYNRLYGKQAKGMLLKFIGKNPMEVQRQPFINYALPIEAYQEVGFNAPPRSQKRQINPKWNNIQIVQGSLGEATLGSFLFFCF